MYVCVCVCVCVCVVCCIAHISCNERSKHSLKLYDMLRSHSVIRKCSLSDSGKHRHVITVWEGFLIADGGGGVCKEQLVI